MTRRLLSLAVAALMVASVAVAVEPPRPPEGSRPILAKGQPAPADGLLATDPWARYDVQRIRWLMAQRDECLSQLAGSPPPSGWRPVVVIAGISVTVGIAGGLALGAKLWRR